ncbi:MAG TPA: ATP-binding protein [Fimbriiglobus sp.]|jgi:signal transduction histidine kinase|nr:ATP-binding protein [Fimbriiglobus sp.]
MSYRAFKRLLGETSLERKCRWLLGTGVLILMSASFYFYARQTEDLAYDQLRHTGRALVSPIVARIHVTDSEMAPAMDDFQSFSEKDWPERLRNYSYRVVRVEAPRAGREPETVDDLAALYNMVLHEDQAEQVRPVPQEKTFLYYGAVRAAKSCIQCHTSPDLLAGRLDLQPTDPKVATLVYPGLEEGQLMAVVRVQLSTAVMESGFHQNRALLITFAVVTTLLILAGSYAVIRYVIVKPVKHLKSVADAIAAGHLNVRSEIQTADEFEDLSDAFNRMLRNLTNMQDRNRNLIADLDRKVDELARVNMALFESNRLKGDFLHTMSHELRTPLNSIIGFSEMLLGADNLTDRQHRWSGNINTSGQHLLALINDILELAKLEAGKMRVHPAELDGRAVCEQAAALHRGQAEKKNVELRVEVPPELPPARQDAGKLGQVLGNLLSNAIKFTPEGGRVTLRAAVEGEQLLFTVADTGVGIAPEEQELVFDKFRQASNPLTREQGGTGLGLSIVRELAKLLGGDVSLRSDLGRGSTFTVRVALRLADDPALAFDLPEEPPPSYRPLPSVTVPALPETRDARHETRDEEPPGDSHAVGPVAGTPE